MISSSFERGSLFARVRKTISTLALLGLTATPAFAQQAPVYNDPYISSQVNVANMNVEAAWRASWRKGAGQKIAVISPGVANVQDLQGKLTSHPISSDPSNLDVGTGMATIAAARAGNGQGIAGMAPMASVVDIKVNLIVPSTRAGQIAAALQAARSEGAKIAVIHIPQVSGTRNFVNEFFPTLDDQTRAFEAMRSYHDEFGGLIFIGIGDGNRTNTTARLPYVMFVEGLNGANNKAATTNTGYSAWFAAPGEFVACADARDQRAFQTGTAYAAASCAGLAALVWADYDRLPNTSIEFILQRASFYTPAYTANRYTWGIPNAALAVNAVQKTYYRDLVDNVTLSPSTTRTTAGTLFH